MGFTFKFNVTETSLDYSIIYGDMEINGFSLYHDSKNPFIDKSTIFKLAHDCKLIYENKIAFLQIQHIKIKIPIENEIEFFNNIKIAADTFDKIKPILRDLKDFI